MSQYNAFPPHMIHSEKPVSQDEALSLISSYLEAAATDPSLHPNALLTESGPTSANSGTNLGVVLHNLQRVEAGLKGEHLEPEFELDYENELAEAEQANAAANGQAGADGTEAQDGEFWQDKSDFEREQEVEEGEIGDQVTATKQNPGGAAAVLYDTMVKPTNDKEARKAAKKERSKQEKKERAEKAKREKEMNET